MKAAHNNRAVTFMVYFGCIKTPSWSNKILHESINIISKKKFLSSTFLPDLCEMIGIGKRGLQGGRDKKRLEVRGMMQMEKVMKNEESKRN